MSPTTCPRDRQERDASGGVSARREPILRVVPPPEPDYDHYLPLVNTAVARTVRRYHLSASDADDLRSEIWLKLLAERGRILRRLRDASRVNAYLARIARNLVVDRQNREWGKWRPSAAARREGRHAILVDRLTTRDGLSLDAADEWLRAAGAPPISAAWRDTMSRLRVRQPRRYVTVEGLDLLSSPDPTPFDTASASESADEARRFKAAVMNTLVTLPQEDRDLLARRYLWGMSVAAIAKTNGVEAKSLYRYFELLLRRIRRTLAASGFSSATASALIGHEGVDWDCGLDRLVFAAAARPRKFA